MVTQPSARMGVLTDLHLAGLDAPDGRWINRQPLSRSGPLLAAALGRLAALELDELLLLGDLVDDGSGSRLDRVGELVASRASARVWAVAGNHDLGTVADPLHRAGLRTPSPEGTRLGPLRLAAGRLSLGRRELRMPDTGRWATGEPVLWLTHFPVLDVEAPIRSAGLPWAGLLGNHAEVHARLDLHDGPVIVLAGHLHVHTAAVERNVLQLDHGALIEPPHTVAVLSITAATSGLDVAWEAHTLERADAGSVSPFLGGHTRRWSWRHGHWSEVAT